MRKKIVSVAIIFLFFALSTAYSPFYYIASADSHSAEIAMELCTGTILKESNSEEKLPMASTTKIMTALLIAEDCDLDKEVKVPSCAVGVEGSSVYLKTEELIDVRDLLYGLMLRSGNDCAVALAIIHSGSVEEFVNCMNKRAKEIGAINTNFANPSGLPDDNHYTTARDLAIISCVAMKNEIIKKVVATKSYVGKYRSYTNKNKMVYNYSGANGVKTGYTVKAGRCLVSSAERNGMDVVCVVLNCYDMYDRSCKILDYCFNNYEVVELSKNKVFMCDRVPCKIDKSCKIVVNKNENISYKVEPYRDIERTISGDLKGKIKLYAQNSLIFESDLYSIFNE